MPSSGSISTTTPTATANFADTLLKNHPRSVFQLSAGPVIVRYDIGLAAGVGNSLLLADTTITDTSMFFFNIGSVRFLTLRNVTLLGGNMTFSDEVSFDAAAGLTLLLEGVTMIWNDSAAKCLLKIDFPLTQANVTFSNTRIQFRTTYVASAAMGVFFAQAVTGSTTVAAFDSVFETEAPKVALAFNFGAGIRGFSKTNGPDVAFRNVSFTVHPIGNDKISTTACFSVVRLARVPSVIFDTVRCTVSGRGRALGIFAGTEFQSVGSFEIVRSEISVTMTSIANADVAAAGFAVAIDTQASDVDRFVTNETSIMMRGHFARLVGFHIVSFTGSLAPPPTPPEGAATTTPPPLFTVSDTNITLAADVSGEAFVLRAPKMANLNAVVFHRCRMRVSAYFSAIGINIDQISHIHDVSIRACDIALHATNAATVFQSGKSMTGSNILITGESLTKKTGDATSQQHESGKASDRDVTIDVASNQTGSVLLFPQTEITAGSAILADVRVVMRALGTAWYLRCFLFHGGLASNSPALVMNNVDLTVNMSSPTGAHSGVRNSRVAAGMHTEAIAMRSPRLDPNDLTTYLPLLRVTVNNTSSRFIDGFPSIFVAVESCFATAAPPTNAETAVVTVVNSNMSAVGEACGGVSMFWHNATLAPPPVRTRFHVENCDLQIQAREKVVAVRFQTSHAADLVEANLAVLNTTVRASSVLNYVFAVHADFPFGPKSALQIAGCDFESDAVRFVGGVFVQNRLVGTAESPVRISIVDTMFLATMVRPLLQQQFTAEAINLEVPMMTHVSVSLVDCTINVTAPVAEAATAFSVASPTSEIRAGVAFLVDRLVAHVLSGAKTSSCIYLAIVHTSNALIVVRNSHLTAELIGPFVIPEGHEFPLTYMASGVNLFLGSARDATILIESVTMIPRGVGTGSGLFCGKTTLSGASVMVVTNVDVSARRVKSIPAVSRPEVDVFPVLSLVFPAVSDRSAIAVVDTNCTASNKDHSAACFLHYAVKISAPDHALSNTDAIEAHATSASTFSQPKTARDFHPQLFREGERITSASIRTAFAQDLALPGYVLRGCTANIRSHGLAIGIEMIAELSGSLQPRGTRGTVPLNDDGAASPYVLRAQYAVSNTFITAVSEMGTAIAFTLTPSSPVQFANISFSDSALAAVTLAAECIPVRCQADAIRVSNTLTWSFLSATHDTVMAAATPGVSGAGMRLDVASSLIRGVDAWASSAITLDSVLLLGTPRATASIVLPGFAGLTNVTFAYTSIHGVTVTRILDPFSPEGRAEISRVRSILMTRGAARPPHFFLVPQPNVTRSAGSRIDVGCSGMETLFGGRKLVAPFDFASVFWPILVRCSGTQSEEVTATLTRSMVASTTETIAVTSTANETKTVVVPPTPLKSTVSPTAEAAASVASIASIAIAATGAAGASTMAGRITMIAAAATCRIRVEQAKKNTDRAAATGATLTDDDEAPWSEKPPVPNSPTQLPLGPQEDVAYHVGAAVMNVLIVLTIALIGVSLAASIHLLRQCRNASAASRRGLNAAEDVLMDGSGGTLQERRVARRRRRALRHASRAQATESCTQALKRVLSRAVTYARMPSVLVIPSLLLLQPTVASAVVVLAKGNTSWLKCVGGVSIGAVVIACGYWIYAIALAELPASFTPQPEESEDEDTPASDGSVDILVGDETAAALLDDVKPPSNGVSGKLRQTKVAGWKRVKRALRYAWAPIGQWQPLVIERYIGSALDQFQHSAVPNLGDRNHHDSSHSDQNGRYRKEVVVTKREAAQFIRRHALLFVDYRGGCSWFGIIEIVIAVTTGICEGLAYTAGCAEAAWSGAALQFIYAAAVIGFRPHVARFELWFTAVEATVLLAGAILAALLASGVIETAAETDDQESSLKDNAIEGSLEAALLTASFVSFARAALDLSRIIIAVIRLRGRRALRGSLSALQKTLANQRQMKDSDSDDDDVNGKDGNDDASSSSSSDSEKGNDEMRSASQRPADTNSEDDGKLLPSHRGVPPHHNRTQTKCEDALDGEDDGEDALVEFLRRTVDDTLSLRRAEEAHRWAQQQHERSKVGLPVQGSTSDLTARQLMKRQQRLLLAAAPPPPSSRTKSDSGSLSGGGPSSSSPAHTSRLTHSVGSATNGGGPLFVPSGASARPPLPHGVSRGTFDNDYQSLLMTRSGTPSAAASPLVSQLHSRPPSRSMSRQAHRRGSGAHSPHRGNPGIPSFPRYPSQSDVSLDDSTSHHRGHGQSNSEDAYQGCHKTRPRFFPRGHDGSLEESLQSAAASPVSVGPGRYPLLATNHQDCSASVTPQESPGGPSFESEYSPASLPNEKGMFPSLSAVATNDTLVFGPTGVATASSAPWTKQTPGSYVNADDAHVPAEDLGLLPPPRNGERDASAVVDCLPTPTAAPRQLSTTPPPPPIISRRV